MKVASQRRHRSEVLVLFAGLVLTLVPPIVPYLGRGRLSDHVRAGHPDYSQARIDSAVDTYLVILTIVGVLTVACWVAAICAVSTGRWWARPLIGTILCVATASALTELLDSDTSGRTGLPPLIGWIEMVPCLAGLLAVALLLRRPPERTVVAPA